MKLFNLLRLNKTYEIYKNDNPSDICLKRIEELREKEKFLLEELDKIKEYKLFYKNNLNKILRHNKKIKNNNEDFIDKEIKELKLNIKKNKKENTYDDDDDDDEEDNDIKEYNKPIRRNKRKPR